MEKEYGDTSKTLNAELPDEPAIPFLGIYPKELKSEFQKSICIPMFIATLFTIANTGKKPKRPLTDEWVRKTVHTKSKV